MTAPIRLDEDGLISLLEGAAAAFHANRQPSREPLPPTLIKHLNKLARQERRRRRADRQAAVPPKLVARAPRPTPK